MTRFYVTRLGEAYLSPARRLRPGELRREIGLDVTLPMPLPCDRKGR